MRFLFFKDDSLSQHPAMEICWQPQDRSSVSGDLTTRVIVFNLGTLFYLSFYHWIILTKGTLNLVPLHVWDGIKDITFAWASMGDTAKVLIGF